VGNHN